MSTEPQQRILIVGASAAGLKAGARAVRLMPGAEITVLDRREFISYGACGLPYFVAGDIDELDELRRTAYGTIRDPAFFAAVKGLDVRTGWTVAAVDPSAHTVQARHEDGSETTLSYDRLVIATGAEARILPGIALGDRVSCLHVPEDARALRRGLETGKVGSAIVVGGGFIGVEMAVALGDLWGCEVTIVEAERGLLPQMLDPEMSALVAAALREKGVVVRTGCPIASARTEDEAAVVAVAGTASGTAPRTAPGASSVAVSGASSGTASGAASGTISGSAPASGDAKRAAADKLRADRAVVALGVRPAVGFAAAAGLAVGDSGALAVDEHLRTSETDIYAAGDCVEVVCAVTGRPRFVPLGSLANRQGRVVGDVLAGLDSRFGPVAGSACVKVFDTNVAATGLSETAARRAGLKARAAWGTFLDVAHYYPEARNIFMKLVYEEGSGRLLGLQAVGPGDAVKRVDMAAGVLRRGGTLEDLLDQEFGYSPPYNAALDPLHGLAATALNQERFGILGVNPLAAVAERTVLDVRHDDEITEARPLIPGALNIRSEELRTRLAEIPRLQPLLVVCEKGPRSAEAALWLRSEGFADVVFLAGGSALRFAALPGEG